MRIERGFVIARQPGEARGALACRAFGLDWISLSSLCSLLFIVVARLQRIKSLFGYLCLPYLHFYVPRYKILIRRLPRKKNTHLLNFVHVCERFTKTLGDVVSLLFYLLSSPLFISRVLSESQMLTKRFSLFSF